MQRGPRNIKGYMGHVLETMIHNHASPNAADTTFPAIISISNGSGHVRVKRMHSEGRPVSRGKLDWDETTIECGSPEKLPIPCSIFAHLTQ